MDEEDTRDYKQPCPQCAEVNWGISDEGKFFCKSCHTVIEKTKEADVSLCFAQNTKIQSLSRGIKRKQTNEKGWEWYICEGFQFILLKQAESLQALGLNPMIKDEAMCNFWRRYLQKSKQAYTKRPYMESQTTFRISESSATSSEQDSLSQTISLETSSASESDYMSDSSAVLSSESAVSVQTGSIDGASYAKLWKIGDLKMSMPMTVAFCYLSLLWMRESITLSNLLWLIFNDCIPYANAVESFPEGTKLYGPDIRIFQPRSFPDYEDVMKKSLALGKFLDLPRFPEITEKCFLHPSILCMKYMMEINLPDELHHWTHRIVKKAGLDKPNVLTFDPVHKRNIYYDVEAAAIIIVVLKILFILDDKKEWWISRKSAVANRKNKDKICFDFQKWYNTMKICIDEAKQKVDEQLARYTWITQRALYYSQKSKSVILKKKQMVGNLQMQFSKLSGTAPGAGNEAPSSFFFNWEEQNTGRTCFHGHSLEGFVKHGNKTTPFLMKYYWLSSLKKCTGICEQQKHYDKSKYPHSYHFVLSLFSFLLRVDESVIHQKVGEIEKMVFQIKAKKKKKKRKHRRTKPA